MNMSDFNHHNPIPMPPPVANTLMHLESPNVRNTNRATLPGSASINPARLNESILQPTSVINLSNSNDVVIGPMTQYQGAVTIYQYMDATVQRAENNNRRNLGLNNKHNTSSNNCFSNLTGVQVWALLLILILIAVAIGVGIHFLIQKLDTGDDMANRSAREILFGNNYEDGTLPNLGMGHLVIDRKQWGASDVLKTENRLIKLSHPIAYVIITHVGVQSRICDNVYNCSIKMRTLQDSAIAEKNLPDLPANFYVSNDGNVYVGRGWYIANEYTNTSMAICFMADYNRYQPSEKQFEAVKFLLSYGISRKFIATDYKLVAHNQTRKTKSPGSYVYREIIKWPRWYACGIENGPPCEEKLRGTF